MGPGSFDPGNMTITTDCYTTIVLQWGRGLSTPEMRKPPTPMRCWPRCFNGAGVFRPRKSAARCNLLGQDAGFNGAGVFRPRK